jgi:ABC-type Fe3+ transport system substrate-binding protein
MTRILAAVLVLSLSACVSEKTTLRNESGQIVRCDNWGFGVIGAPVAIVSHADCVKKAKAAGYSDLPK